MSLSVGGTADVAETDDDDDDDDEEDEEEEVWWAWPSARATMRRCAVREATRSMDGRVCVRVCVYV
jgi:hypothetical protein